ncbi:Neurexin-4 [Halotydeus destructor]|nr:Neurexin-4 [Halotydeus destructor]
MRIQLYGCDYVAESINFDGRGYVRFDLTKRPVQSYEELIRFRFRTNFADGHILYSKGTQGDALSLRLEKNKLVLELDLGGEGTVNSISAGSLLDDNLWHEVLLTRVKRDILVTVDRVMVRHHLHGDFVRLDLNHELFIGGVPIRLQSEVKLGDNFTGCIENLMINNTNLVEEIKIDERQYLYHRIGETLFSCQFEQVIPVTFATEASHLKIDGFFMPFMNCSFDFRTFNEDGLLLYNKFNSAGFLKLFLDKGKVVVQVQGKGTPVVTIDPFPDRMLNDGLWHMTRVVLKKDSIVVEVDSKPSITTRQFEMSTGQTYLLGGGHFGTTGFIGCMRHLYIEGRYVHVKSLTADRIIRTRPSDILFDACQMIDRCHPNPCEHGALCRQNHIDFNCDCSGTGYHGAVCHIAKNPLSCEAYKIQFPRSKRAEIDLDVDGSGPLEPFPVTCIFLSEDRTQTVIHHNSEGSTTVRGFQEPGSYVHDITYAAPYEQVVILVNRSYSCKQPLRFECHNARLLNSPYPGQAAFGNFTPFSWWVSRNNQKMDYWGGSLPGSRRCACGLSGTCKDSSKWCNCDSFGGRLSNEIFADEGDLVEKDFLPVRQLRIGDTGAPGSSTKWGRYTVGPLSCEGDTMFDNAVTFRYSDATIDLPTFDMGYSADIYLQFKTTADSGVLFHSKGPNDFIKLSIFSSKSIQFEFSAGAGSKSATVEASYRLNDNNWHSVLVERNKKEARLIVDGELSADARTNNGPIRALQLTSQLIIGATVDYREGFVGCIRSLLLNGQFVDLHRMASRGLYGVTTGCSGKCESNPCLNNGTCIDGYSSYTCDCQWTAFKGPICADEIGVNLRSDTFIKYDFETTISTLQEHIRVGFTTTAHKGLIFGVSSYSGEYLSLVMSTSGHLRLVFDFGFERQEIIIRTENFALGQHHDITLRRTDKGSKMSIWVDNNEPIVHTFRIKSKGDAQFDRLKSIYIGRNETMDTGDGFVGCVSRISFDDHFPLRRLFQENRRSNVKAFPSDDSVREDTCGIEPITHPEEEAESRPPPTLGPYDRRPYEPSSSNAGLIVAIIIFIILVVLIIAALMSGRFVDFHQGNYVTHEDSGARAALDPDTAVVKGLTGPDIVKKKEYFI